MKKHENWLGYHRQLLTSIAIIVTAQQLNKLALRTYASAS